MFKIYAKNIQDTLRISKNIVRRLLQAVNAAFGLAMHARAHTVKWPCASVFAGAGIAGAALGAWAGKMVDGDMLLALFGLLMTGILLAAKMNASLAHKPMFFVFSKPDLHKLTPDRVEDDFRRAMAIPLGPLRRMKVNVGQYNVQCAGWGMDSSLSDLGIDVLLSDLAHAIGAVPIKN